MLPVILVMMMSSLFLVASLYSAQPAPWAPLTSCTRAKCRRRAAGRRRSPLRRQANAARAGSWSGWWWWFDPPRRQAGPFVAWPYPRGGVPPFLPAAAAHSGSKWLKSAKNKFTCSNLTNFPRKFHQIYINSVSGHWVCFISKNCRRHKYDRVNFTNFLKSNFWRDFDIWLYCVAVVLLLHQSGFCPLCRKAPKIPKTCCSQTTEKSLTLFMAPILTLTARPLPAPDPSGTMSRNNFCWRSSLNFMLYYLLFHEI